MNDRGFSMVELLVTLAIVAVLAAAAFPALRSANDATRRVQCVANLRQIGTGLFAYAAEHENRLPPPIAGGWANGGDQSKMWSYAVWPYVYGSYIAYKYPDNALSMGTPVYPVCVPNVFRCPATRRRQVNTPAAGNPLPSRYSYGLNCGPTASIWTQLDQPIPLPGVVRPSRAAMVLEASNPPVDNDTFLHYWGMIPHTGGSNVLFYDGHVEWLAFSRIPASASDAFWIGR